VYEMQEILLQGGDFMYKLQILLHQRVNFM